MDAAGLAGGDPEVTTVIDGGNLIEDLKSGIDTLRAGLSDMQGLERDLNFMLNDVLNLQRDLGDKTALHAAYNRLVNLAPTLSGASSDDEILQALAAIHPRYSEIVFYRDYTRALELLSEYGLDSSATSQDITNAVAIGQPTEPLGLPLY